MELLRAGKEPGDAEWELFMSAYRLTLEQIETVKREEMKLF